MSLILKYIYIYVYIYIYIYIYIVNLFRITSRKTEQPIQGTELQEREEDKDEKHLEKLIRRPRREQMPIRSKHRAI